MFLALKNSVNPQISSVTNPTRLDNLTKYTITKTTSFPKKIKVLVTGIGGPSGICTAYALRMVNNIRLVGADANPKAKGLCLADKAYCFPLVQEKNYLTVFNQVVDTENIDLVIPSIDEELRLLASNSKYYNRLPLLISPASSLTICLDKKATYDVLKNKSYIPTLYNASKIQKGFFTNKQLFVKPRNSRGSRGCLKIDSFGTLQKFLDNSQSIENLLFTEFFEGKEWSVDAVLDSNGKPVVLVSRIRTMKEGNPIDGQCIKNKKLLKIAEEICKTIKMYGPINIQFMEHKNHFYLLEINPRFSGGDYIPLFSGINLPLIALSTHYSYPWQAQAISRKIRLADNKILKECFFNRVRR